MKRILSMLLMLALVLSLLSGVASASRQSDAAQYLKEYVMEHGEYRSNFNNSYVYSLPDTRDFIGTSSGDSFLYSLETDFIMVSASAYGPSARFDIPLSGIITECLASDVGNEEWIPIDPKLIRADTKLLFTNFDGTEKQQEFTEQYLTTAFHRLLSHVNKALKTGGYSLADLGFVNYTPYDSVCYYLTDCPGKKFTDMPTGGTWAHDPIDWAVRNNITTGTSATTFSPDMACSRGQIVTFLWRAAGSPKASVTEHPFTDVTPGSYYYDAMLWAVEKGITTGSSATTFSPDRVCSRSEVVTFLWRANGSPAAENENLYFADVEEGSFYEEAVAWAVSKNITQGTGEGAFSPKLSCSRAQVVTFLYRAIEFWRLLEEGYLF